MISTPYAFEQVLCHVYVLISILSPIHDLSLTIFESHSRSSKIDKHNHFLTTRDMLSSITKKGTLKAW
jgi:hypothetical protein